MEFFKGAKVIISKMPRKHHTNGLSRVAGTLGNLPFHLLTKELHVAIMHYALPYSLLNTEC
jgi:hypothetical protein